MPGIAMIRVTEEFLEANRDVYMQLGSQRFPPTTGWHFGSRFPGNPGRMAVYDRLPDALLGKIANLSEFAGVLAFDKWTATPMRFRRSSFGLVFKEQENPEPAASPAVGFIAQMVDNGYVFEGLNWRLTGSPVQGLYFRPVVYRTVHGWADFEPWLERIRHFPEDVVDQALKEIPSVWMMEDREILERLLARRKRVPDLIVECRKARSDPFPDWSEK